MVTVAMASPEDVILSKLEWAKKAGGSNRQLEDAAGVLRISGSHLDRPYIDKWAAELGVAEIWHALLKGEQSEGDR